MELSKWIEDKKDELIKSKLYKTVNFSGVENVEIDKNMTSEIFDFKKIETPMNTEVEDFIRSELTEKIKGLRITFKVIKPRYRKSESLYLYVKLL